jgi:hypothetical protein
MDQIQSTAAAPSRILPPHPQVWVHAAQPLGLSRERQTTARPLMWANLLLRSTAYIIQTNVASAVPRLGMGMLRNLYRLLAPSSVHTIYYHRTRARVINYWHQGRQRATSVPPDHPRRKNEENRSRTARGSHVAPVDICLKANWPFEKCDKRALNRYEGFNSMAISFHAVPFGSHMPCPLDPMRLCYRGFAFSGR